MLSPFAPEWVSQYNQSVSTTPKTRKIASYKTRAELLRENSRLKKHLRELEASKIQASQDVEIVRVFRSSPIGLFIIQDGKFKFVNENFRGVVTGSVTDLLETESMKLVVPEDRGMLRENAIRMLKGENIPPYKYRIKTNTGQIRWLLEGVVSIQYQGKRAVLGHTMDITEREAAQEILADAYEKERKARKDLEAEVQRRVEFTRALVHELKTPLTPIMSSSELLTSGLKLEPWLSVAKNILRGAANLNRRIDELLDVARGEIGRLRIRPARVNVMRLLQQIAGEMMSVAAANGQSLNVELPPYLPAVWGDDDRLRQIVLNLLINATKFTPEGGKITLRARENDQHILFQVEDTGRGILVEDQRNLFQAYHRQADEQENLSGLGLGLYLCKLLVDLHGGKIWAESFPGRGTTFSFTIPIHQTEKEPEQSDAKQEAV